MEVNINKKDLRKIRQRLGKLVSNVNRAHFREQSDTLTELITYIDETPLLGGYIKSLEYDVAGLEEEVRKANGSYGREAINQGFNAGERTYTLYCVFKQVIEENLDTCNFGRFYAGSTKYQDMAEAFGSKMVYPFYSEIESYLSEIAIDMGYDENETISYHIDASGDGVQVNVASNGAKIQANQTNTWNKTKVYEEIEKLEDIIQDIDTGVQKNALENNIQLLKQELKKTNPVKMTISTLLSNLKLIAMGISVVPDFTEGIKLIANIIGVQI